MKKILGVLIISYFLFLGFSNKTDSEKELINEIKNNNYENILVLLKDGVSPNIPNLKEKKEDVLTPLTFAVAKNNEKVIDLLLEYNADINLGTQGINPLYVASRSNNLLLVEKLINMGADVDYISEYGETVLMGAVPIDNKEILKYIISQSKNLEIKNMNGVTALLKACYLGNKKTIVSLVEGGAQLESRDNEGVTPLGALLFRHSQIGRMQAGIEDFNEEENLYLIEFLLINGAKIDVKINNDFDLIDYVDSKEVMNLINKYRI